MLLFWSLFACLDTSTSPAPVAEAPPPTEAPSEPEEEARDPRVPHIDVVDAATLPTDEAEPEGQAVIGPRFRYVVPVGAEPSDDGLAWTWTEDGMMVKQRDHRVWVTAEPWPDGDADSYAEHLTSELSDHDIKLGTGRVFVRGATSSVPRLQVIGEDWGRLLLPGVVDGVAYTWTCELRGKARHSLALGCMMPGTHFHLDPPPLPDRADTVEPAKATPLWSVARDDWPCGATSSTGATIAYEYGDVDRCTLQPFGNHAACPTRVLTTLGEDTSTSTYRYDGERLVARTHVDGDDEDAYRYAHEGDVLTAIAKDRGADGSDDRTTAVTHRADGTVVTNDGFLVTRIHRDEADHIVTVEDALSRRDYTWAGDRLTRMVLNVGERETADVRYRYVCD